MKKLLVVGIILLLVCVSIPSTGMVMETSSAMSSNGNTLYVGGSGEGNYTRIQDAINDASDGDTVFVYSGVYNLYDWISINKSINLIGEDKNITYIDGSGSKGIIFLIESSDVSVCKFTLKNCVKDSFGQAIYLWGNPHLENIYISDCIMENNDKGIYCINVSNFFIGNCYIHHNNGPALDGYNLSNVEVNNCLVHDNGEELKDGGIRNGGFEFGMGNEIHSNLTVSDCVIHDNIGMGINIMKGDKVSVYQNDIYRNSWRGVRFISVSNIIIHHNQIFENGEVGIIGEGYIVSNIEIIDNNVSKNGQGNEFYHGGIYLQGCSPGVIIKNNNISSNNGTGIYPNGTPDIIIMGNDIIGNAWDGIYLPKFYDFFTIKNNNIKGNLNGISITCNNTNVSGNIISKNEIGIGLYYGSNNVIHGNEISNNNEGIYISTGATSNEISCNNLMNNNVQANFYYRFTDSLPSRRNNNFHNNYWNRLRLIPKPIFGKLRIRITIFGKNISETIPWLNFDWHPALKPYDI